MIYIILNQWSKFQGVIYLYDKGYHTGKLHKARTCTFKRRQAIVEHPYGTIKRQWGFNFILTIKSLERANADAGFMMVAYNLSLL